MERYAIRQREICIADFEVEAHDETDALARFKEWSGRTDDVRARMDCSSWWEVETEVIPLEKSEAEEGDVLTDEEWRLREQRLWV